MATARAHIDDKPSQVWFTVIRTDKSVEFIVKAQVGFQKPHGTQTEDAFKEYILCLRTISEQAAQVADIMEKDPHALHIVPEPSLFDLLAKRETDG